MARIASLFLAAAACAAGDPRVAFDRAAAALAAHDYGAAERGFQEVLKAVPGHAGALGNLGVVYARTQRHSQAIEVYQRALKLAPRDPGLSLNLGLAYVSLRQYGRALALFEKLPRTGQVRELLATCQIHDGRPAEALAALEGMPLTAGVAYLRGLAYARLKQPEQARAALAEMMSAATPAQAAFLMGKAEYDEGRFETAAESFQKALAAGFPGSHLELGKTYLSLRRNAEAETELRLALGDDPSEANYYLGGLLIIARRYAEAAPFLEKARALNPDSWAACYYLGRVRLAGNQPSAAIALLERAAALNPNEPAVFYQLAQAFKKAGRAAESRRALERVLALNRGKLDDEIERLGRVP